VFDLDPARDDDPALVTAALALRALLRERGLAGWVKTSGSKGFHVVVPLVAEAGFDDVARFAHGLAARLVERDPEHLTLAFSKVDRDGRIYVDVGRNGYSATIAAAYAVRARPGAPVSAPCTWPELERGDARPRAFTLRGMAARIAAVGDAWADMTAQTLPA
jgi:bifunctional non-homologous end joining protein LigD